MQRVQDSAGPSGGLNQIIVVEDWFDELNRLVPLETTLSYFYSLALALPELLLLLGIHAWYRQIS